MKILYLIPTLGSGGAERQLSLIAPALAIRGAEVHVAYSRGGPNLARLSASGVHLHVLTSSGNYDPALAVNILRLVQRLKPDVIQTWLTQMDILGGLVALIKRVPLVISERSSSELYSRGWKSRVRLLVGCRAEAVIANSIGGKNYWLSHVRTTDRLYLVRNCVVVPTLDKAQVNQITEIFLKPSDQRPLVLFAGRFSYEKNISTMIDALILVAQSLPQAVFALLGDGPERDITVNKLMVAGLTERVFIPGFCEHVPAWMKRAIVCVSVSHFEGHPNVALEAAASGCPLVLSDIPAHREIFDDSAVMFVKTDSSRLISNTILNVISNPRSAEKRAERAQSIVQTCNLATVVDSYESIYRKLTSVASAVQS